MCSVDYSVALFLGPFQVPSIPRIDSSTLALPTKFMHNFNKVIHKLLFYTQGLIRYCKLYNVCASTLRNRNAFTSNPPRVARIQLRNPSSHIKPLPLFFTHHKIFPFHPIPSYLILSQLNSNKLLPNHPQPFPNRNQPSSDSSPILYLRTDT